MQEILKIQVLEGANVADSEGLQDIWELYEGNG